MLTREDAQCHAHTAFEVLKELETGLGTSLNQRSKGRRRAQLHRTVRFRGKAEMNICGMSAFAVAIGVKRTCLFALHMSAFDPKRTLMLQKPPVEVLPFSLLVCHDTMPYLDCEGRR